MSLSDDCFKGVRFEGQPEGKIEQIGGVEAYISTPTTEYAKDAVVLLFTDIYGMQFINNQLMADDFARNGLKTVMIDIFNADPVPLAAMTGEAPGHNRAEWRKIHTPESIKPMVAKAIAALSAQGISKFAAVGYCYGARVCFDLAFEHKLSAAAIAHPSLLKIPDDFEKYKTLSSAPLLINSAEVDEAFPVESRLAADEILGEGQFAPGYRRLHWEGCNHGFAVRGDVNIPKVKEGKEGAFKATVEWFQKYL